MGRTWGTFPSTGWAPLCWLGAPCAFGFALSPPRGEADTFIYRGRTSFRFASCPSHRQAAGGVGAAPALAVHPSVLPPALTSFPDTHRFPAHGSHATSDPALVSTERCVSQRGGRGKKEKKKEKRKEKINKKRSFSFCPHHGPKQGAGWTGGAHPCSELPRAPLAPAHPSHRPGQEGPRRQLWSPMVGNQNSFVPSLTA